MNNQQQVQQQQKQQYRAASPADIAYGSPIKPDMCGVCGAEMEPEDRFCAECGSPRGAQPQAQAAPAQQTLQKAQDDPKYQRVLELYRQVAELQQKIQASATWVEDFHYDFEDEDFDEEEPLELSEQDKALLNEYESLLNMLQGGVPEAQKPEPAAPKKERPKRPRIHLEVDLDKMQELIDGYKQKVQELNEALEDMAPDPGMPPQMQHDYYAERPLPDKNFQFICNKCGNRHANPADCPMGGGGGKWFFDNPLIGETMKNALEKLIDITVKDIFHTNDYQPLPEAKHDVEGGQMSHIQQTNSIESPNPSRLIYSGPDKKTLVLKYEECVEFDIPNGRYSVVGLPGDPSVRPFAGKFTFSGGCYQYWFVVE